MSTNSRSFVDRIVVPRRVHYAHAEEFGHGIDFSADGVCLVDLRQNGRSISRLIWLKGHMYADSGIRGFGSSYHAASLSIYQNRGFRSRTLETGGRLSKTMVLRHAGHIDEVFGEGTAVSIDIMRTLVIADG